MAGINRQPQPAGPRAFSFGDLERQGRELVEQAQARAAAMVQAAQRRAAELADQLGEAARAEGFRQGLAEGRAEGLKQIRAEAQAQAVAEAQERIAELVGALTVLLSEFEKNKRRLIAAAETGLIELALAIARRVCKLEAGASTAAAQANARALLEMVQHVGDAELHFHPAEADGLREVAAELVARAEQLGHVRIIADAQIERGGCVLALHDGEIDARLETQLDRIAAALRVDGGAADG